MRRLLDLFDAALTRALALAQAPAHAQTDGGYKLVPNWPTLPPGDFFGLKTPPPPPAEREAQAAARRATGRRQRAASRGTGADQPTRHLGPGDRSAGSHLRVQPRREAGDGVQHRRQAGRVGRRSGAERQEARSELAALGRGRLGRQRLHDRARRASHRQDQSEDGQGAAAARHDDGEGQRRQRTSICRPASPC